MLDLKEQINKAMRFHQSGDLKNAEKEYREILDLNPDNANVLNLLGLLSHQNKILDDALDYIQKAIKISPSAYFFESLGRVYLDVGNFSKAIEAYKKSLEFKPDEYEVIFNLALAYKNNFQFNEAIEAYKKALEINPSSLDAYFNMAYLYLSENNPHEAINCYKKVLELDPDDCESKYFLSLALLQVQNHKEGWHYFEERLCRASSIITQSTAYPNLTQKAPIWQGEDIKDKAIYTYYEAGFGDVLMFARYLPILKERCGKILFKPQQELVELFKENPLGCEIIERTLPEEMMDFDCHIPLMSLPYVLGLEGDDNFISSEGYFSANPEKTKLYREKYFDNDKFKIGIKWQGNTYYDTGRVIKVESFFKLFDLAGTKFYSAQTFEGSQELEKLTQKYDIVDLGKTFRDFSDTAGAVENMDLIICNDTSLAHLAGAMGKPCWILLPYVYNWRWHVDLNPCKWYKSVKLFRQNEPDNWDEVFERVYQELKDLV